MTIGLLSWGAEKTLENTLKSYSFYRLEKEDDERLVLLQEGTDQQANLCRYYGWEPIIHRYNLGIAQGYKTLVESATGEHFLFLENDWELIEWPTPSLLFGHQLLNTGDVDIIRLRHRDNPGAPLWTKQYEGREFDKPTHLLDSIHWTDPRKFLEVITKDFEYVDWNIASLEAERRTMTWYITSSKYANWTNNPHMATTQFLRHNILPRLGNRDLEIDIQSWWEQQNFRVAQSDGLFTHRRLD